MCRMLRAARMLCLFLLCSALAACTAMPGRSAWDSAAAQSGAQAGAMPALRPRPRNEFYVQGDGALYRTIACSGGGGLVTCLDLSTLEERVLCSAEGCAHGSAACPAWMPGAGMLFLSQGTLYSYSTVPQQDGGSGMPLASLRAHALDGSRAHEVAQVSGSWQLGVFAQGGGAVYGIMDQHLARLELATGHETILERNFYLNHNFSLYGLGELDGNIVIPMTEDGLQVFYAMDANGIFTELCRGSYGPGCFHEGKYYYSDTVTGSLYCWIFPLARCAISPTRCANGPWNTPGMTAAYFIQAVRAGSLLWLGAFWQRWTRAARRKILPPRPACRPACFLCRFPAAARHRR